MEKRVRKGEATTDGSGDPIAGSGRRGRVRSAATVSPYVALRVDDVAAVLRRLGGSGARVISRHPVTLHDPDGAWDGVVCCYLADRDGVIVELVQRPVRG